MLPLSTFSTTMNTVAYHGVMFCKKYAIKTKYTPPPCRQFYNKEKDEKYYQLCDALARFQTAEVPKE